ncbi:hypothetical protein STANM309S_04705 [Streptomyces tanashiensis]
MQACSRARVPESQASSVRSWSAQAASSSGRKVWRVPLIRRAAPRSVRAASSAPAVSEPLSLCRRRPRRKSAARACR